MLKRWDFWPYSFNPQNRGRERATEDTLRSESINLQRTIFGWNRHSEYSKTLLTSCLHGQAMATVAWRQQCHEARLAAPWLTRSLEREILVTIHCCSLRESRSTDMRWYSAHLEQSSRSSPLKRHSTHRKQHNSCAIGAGNHSHNALTSGLAAILSVFGVQVVLSTTEQMWAVKPQMQVNPVKMNNWVFLRICVSSRWCGLRFHSEKVKYMY